MREKFGDLRWVPLQPEFIEYPNAQILMIGGATNSWGKAATAEGVKQPDEPEPGQELERLAEENEHRVEHLEGKLSESRLPFFAHLTSSMQAMILCSRIWGCTQTTIALFLPHGTVPESYVVQINVPYKI